MSAPRLELFYRTAHGPSVRVRRYVAEYALRDVVRLRSLTVPGAEPDFLSRGGHTLPALWDGHTLHQGAEAVLARLQAVVNLGRE
jgi:hypothetical protein